MCTGLCARTQAYHGYFYIYKLWICLSSWWMILSAWCGSAIGAPRDGILRSGLCVVPRATRGTRFWLAMFMPVHGPWVDALHAVRKNVLIHNNYENLWDKFGVKWCGCSISINHGGIAAMLRWDILSTVCIIYIFHEFSSQLPSFSGCNYATVLELHGLETNKFVAVQWCTPQPWQGTPGARHLGLGVASTGTACRCALLSPTAHTLRQPDSLRSFQINCDEFLMAKRYWWWLLMVNDGK